MYFKFVCQLILPAITIIIITGPPISPNPYLVKNATHLTLMWSPPFLWPGQRIQQYNISVTNNERIEYHMLDTSLTNPIVTVSFPTSPSLLQFNAQNMLACMPITFSISPVYDGSILEKMQTFNISDWIWTFPLGKCKSVCSGQNLAIYTTYYTLPLF